MFFFLTLYEQLFFKNLEICVFCGNVLFNLLKMIFKTVLQDGFQTDTAKDTAHRLRHNRHVKLRNDVYAY